MPTYSTKQRKLLLDYFSKHIDEPLSAKQITAALSEANISLSAVYRNLALLEESGEVKRYSKSGSREIYYRYIDPEKCREHLHLSCKTCGATIHLDAEDTNILINRIAAKKNFRVVQSDTVLYGICENCQKWQKGKKPEKL